MEKRVVLAAALSIAVLILWGWLFPAPKRMPAAPAAVVTAEPSPTATAAPADPPPAEPSEPVAPIAAAAPQEIVVETDLFVLTLTNAGGRVASWKLRDYTANDGTALELLPQFSDMAPQMLAIEVDDAELTEKLNSALYAVDRRSADSAEEVAFAWSDGGIEARKKLTVHAGSYVVEAAVEVVDHGRPLPARLLLGPGFGAQEGAKHSTYYYEGQAVWNSAGRVTRLKGKKLQDPGGFTAELRWAGLEDQYFAALVLPGEAATRVAWHSVEATEASGHGDADVKPAPRPLLAVTVPSEGARIFVGPKKYSLLRELGSELDRAVWFASNPFVAWIARFIFLCLIWLHDHTVANYGMAIILATLLLRVLLFPVNQYSMVSMKKTQLQMQRLQPKIKRIREKYKKYKDAESRGKMNQEMMDLYRSEGVNPMGGLNGCLPMLAQFPILIGFYNMLTVAIELRGAPFFGWIHDLSRADPYWVTPVLMGITMLLQQRMAMSKVKDPMQAQQQRMMLIMPFVFTWICLQMPAGMVLYWFVNNLLGMGQQWLVNRHTARLEAAEQGA